MTSCVLAAALLLYATTVMSPADASPPPLCSVRGVGTAFVSPISRHSTVHPLMSIQRKTPQTRRVATNLDTTWSNAVRKSTELNESRFGVRRRVRSVLDKAKKRSGTDSSLTGTERFPKKANGESSFVQTGPNIIAETASLGGLGEVIVDDEGTIDVALEYKPSSGKEPNKGKNGASYPSSSGEKYEDPAVLTKLADGVAKVNGVKVSKPSSRPENAPSTAPTIFERPEDDFILCKRNDMSMINDTASKPYGERDAFSGDVSAAFSIPREPLPFELPTLDAELSRRVTNGERVQFQDDMGRAGSGFVVWDIKAPESVVWDCLLDFQSYPQTIPTVREVVMFTNTHLKEDYRAEKPIDFEDGTAAICKHGVPSVTRAQFALSKFRLKIAAVHKYRPHPKGDYMIFTLDPASRNMVLKYAKGIWYTQSNPDGKEGYTRVWLLCELRVSKLLPQWIVDYAAERAMPRATTWLKPQCEAAAMLWLKDSAKR